MHIKTFLTVLLFSLLTFSFVSTRAVAASNVGVLVATVNIQDGAITSQQGNTINIVFTLSNGEGVQSGVQYGVQLYSETTKGKMLIDEKVYDEKLNLSENTSLRKGISYTAPATLSGSYEVLLTSKNSANFPFAVYPLGKVKLAAVSKGMVITPDSCTATLDKKPKVYSVKDTLMLSSSLQIVVLTCTATNTETVAVSTVPTVTTKERSGYGSVVETDPVVTPALTFKAGEKKSFSIVMPLAKRPHTYVANLSFVTGDVLSNTVPIMYTVRGASATISNLSLDKDFYKRGETAALSLIWSGSTPTVSAKVVLTNSLGLNCAKPIEQSITPATIEVLIPVTASCRDPHVVVSLKDASDGTLDTKEFSAITTSTPKTDKTLFIVVIILGALAIAGIYLKKHKKGSSTSQIDINNVTPLRAMLPVVLLAGLMSLIPFSRASANTIVYTSGPSGSVQSFVSVNPVTYSPNNPINISWDIHNNHTSPLPISLTAINDVGLGASNPSVTLVSPTSIAANGGIVSGFDFVTFTAPAVPAPSGSYAIRFETGVDVGATPTVYVKVTQTGATSGSNQYCLPSDLQVYGWENTQYLAEFFSDPQGLNPIDVSGLGFQLRQEHYYDIPTWVSSTMGTETVLVPIASGTSYSYIGFSYYESPTDGWGCSSSDVQTHYSGYMTLDGGGITPIAYSFIPQPPTASISAPSGAYQGNDYSVSWSSSNATSCVGTGFSTGGSTSGTIVTNQTSATTYSIACSNVLGTANDSTTVDDWGPAPPPPPTCTEWPGSAVSCNPPSSCVADPVHPGYEVCY